MDDATDGDHGCIVLFDGECNLCSASVQFIIKRDPGGVFSFASIQSAVGSRLLAERGIDPAVLDAIVVVDDSRWFSHSDAALHIARHLSGLWPALAVLRIVPRPIRDAVYTIIARNRYRWFGRRETCLVPTPALRSRFLDQ